VRVNDDRETQAAERLGAAAYDYFAGGAGEERVLRENVEGWAAHPLAPRVLVDVSEVDTSVTVLGQRWQHPVGIAPMAYQRHAHDDGELAMARAAAASGTMLTLSSQTTTPPDEVAAAMGEAPRWFQLYVFRDRSVTDDLVAAAREGGFGALVITVDFPVGGVRDRDRASGFSPSHPTLLDRVAGTDGTPLTLAERHALHDPSVSWDDIAGYAEASGLPVVIKGVLCPEDARRAVDAGAAGVVVSNHGGRQLDAVLSTASALAPIVDSVEGRASVLVDGGIRRGWDVARALAVGADAVLLGRPVLWGLATDGEAGARQVIDEIVEELESTLALIGCPRAADLDPQYLVPRRR